LQLEVKVDELNSEKIQKNSKLFLDAPLIGGLFMAFFSVIPILGLFNILCCMWLVVGGGVSYIIASKKEEYIPKSSDGLIYGALSGVFGWIFFVILQFIMMGIKAKKLAAIKERIINMNTPEAEKIIGLLDKFGIKLITLIVSMGLIIFFLIFPTIGGAITQAIIKKDKKTDGKKENSGEKVE